MNFLLTNAQKELLLYIQLIPEYIAEKAEFKGENLKNVVDKLVEGDSDFTPQDLEYLEDEGFIDSDYNLIQKGIVFVEDFAFSEKQDILLKDRKKKEAVAGFVRDVAVGTLSNVSSCIIQKLLMG